MQIVLTGGKFNHIHPGHVWLLKKAKELGYLIVVLANDRHNKRPYAISAAKRKKALQNLKIADKVVVGSPKSFVNVLKRYKPNIIVLGYDQRLPDIETGDYAREHRIIVVRMKKYGSHATKKIAR